MNRPRRPGRLATTVVRVAGPVVERLRDSDSRSAAVLRRAANRLRPEIDADVQAAQAATDRRDWPEAARRWGDLVRRYAMVAPPKAWARLAIAHRELGDHGAAAQVLRQAIELFPDDLGLAMEQAQLAMVREDWDQAARCWTDVIDRFPTTAPAKAHARLAIAHRELGRVDLAAALIDRAQLRFPGDVDIAMDWAQFAMVAEDWTEAIRRWREVLERFPDVSSARASARLAQCHRELGDHVAAEEILDQAHRAHPDDLLVATERAQSALARENWPEALDRWESLRQRFEAELPAKAFAQISIVHRRLGDPESASRVVERGLHRHPHDVRLVGERAQLAMAAEDWPEAVGWWQRVLALRTAASDRGLQHARFPRTSSAVDWYELAWKSIAERWDWILPQLDTPPTAQFYRAVARTLADANLTTDADAILRRGLDAHPTDAALAYDHVVTSLLMSHGPGRGADVETLRVLADRVRSTPSIAAECRDLADARDGRRSARHAALDAVLGSHAPSQEARSSLDRMYILRVPRESSLELHVRAGRFLSASALRARVREVSERDQWPEMRAPENLLMRRTREVADAFGARFEDLPFLPADTMADAMFFPLYHELVLYEPMVRVAADIAAEDDDSPVYLEISTLTFRYLDGYSFSSFDVLYLYFELRRLGVNAVLCRLSWADPDGDGEDEDAESSMVAEQLGRVRIVPSARAIIPRGTVRRPDHHTHEAAIMPAGLRSIHRVVSAVDGALVYASGSIVKEFAYDRSIRQAFPIEPHATVHPDTDRMATFVFELWPAETIPTAALTGGPPSPESTLEVTAPVGGDWLSWLDSAMHGFLRELSVRSFAEVAAREIKTAHVCDHVFTESVVFAHAVKACGGRVVLWPHSANPVHLDQRRPETFDEVHAVTRTGAAQWRAQFPGHVVHHSPRLMLDPPRAEVAYDPSAPLSVIVLGGRSVLRHTPTMDQAAHEASYQAFFAGIEKLQADHDVDIWFKPRGLTGEHEMWLHQVVGDTGGWRRVLAHPMRMQLPNPLFVSISMGTSALLEGIGRGIPGLVVRDFPVRDYTTIDPRAFPTIPTAAALELVDSCTTATGWQALLDRETAYYSAELVHAD